jgi:hypothetical protein
MTDLDKLEIAQLRLQITELETKARNLGLELERYRAARERIINELYLMNPLPHKTEERQGLRTALDILDRKEGA